MLISKQLTMSFATMVAAASLFQASHASADEQKDTTSETAITEMAKRVIKGVDEDNTTLIPTGDARASYLQSKNFDAKVVQDKVNDLLASEVVPEIAPSQTAQAVVTPQVQQAASDVSQATNTSGNSAAKEWIAQRESSGSYTAQNGRYIGRYQLTDSYLNGDYSPANQERTADNYVASRYGSWEAAQQFWLANGWY